MTRKHFELIARTLESQKPILSDETWHQAQYVQWERMVQSFAEMCHNLNPRFNADRFFAACGKE